MSLVPFCSCDLMRHDIILNLRLFAYLVLEFKEYTRHCADPLTRDSHDVAD